MFGYDAHRMVDTIEKGYDKLGRDHGDAPRLKGWKPQPKNGLDHGQLTSTISYVVDHQCLHVS